MVCLPKKAEFPSFRTHKEVSNRSSVIRMGFVKTMGRRTKSLKFGIFLAPGMESTLPKNTRFEGFDFADVGRRCDQRTFNDCYRRIQRHRQPPTSPPPEPLARLRQLAHKAHMDLGDHGHTGSGARFFDGAAPVRSN